MASGPNNWIHKLNWGAKVFQAFILKKSAFYNFFPILMSEIPGLYGEVIDSLPFKQFTDRVD